MHAWSGVVQGIAPAVARRGMEAGSMGASAPGVWRVSPRGGRVAGRAAASRRRGLHMMAERVKTMVVVGGGPAGFMAAIQAARAAEDELSGVNLDEEASRLMEQQQAYKAAAQILQTARQMFDTLVGIM